MPELKEWGAGARSVSRALVYVWIGLSVIGLAVVVAVLIAALQAVN